MPTKPIYQSKTFWFNVVTTALTFSQYLPPKYGFYTNVIGNVLLRFVTKSPVSLTGA